MPKTVQKDIDILDPELQVLQSIYVRQDRIRQRDLSRIVGLSLGMTNAIVKRLVEKGWLTIRRINSRNIRYAVSAAGIDEITRRSYRFFRRTIKNIVHYRDAIEALVRDTKAQGYQWLVLVGSSDLDFIVEHACVMCDLRFVREEPQESAMDYFLLYSESYIADPEEKRARRNVAFLQEVVGGTMAPPVVTETTEPGSAE